MNISNQIPVCQWATCLRTNEIVFPNLWITLQNECIHRRWNNESKNFECWFGKY
ncbi:MAG: hypothetical protein RLY43_2156 [Bacteroidota bacterium]|jgi:hypothetical protein